MRSSLLFIIGLTCAMAATGAVSDEALRIENAWMREPAPGQPNGAVYMTLVNSGDQPVTLVSASTSAAERAEIHEHQHTDGMMRMRRVPELTVAAGQRLTFRPHGYHLMLFGLKTDALGEGPTFCITDRADTTWCAPAEMKE